MVRISYKKIVKNITKLLCITEKRMHLSKICFYTAMFTNCTCIVISKHKLTSTFTLLLTNIEMFLIAYQRLLCLMIMHVFK